MTTPLWKHQERALDFVETHDATLVHYGMGTGKSRVIVEYVRRHRPRNTLIVCPLAVIPVWPYQLEKHAPGLDVSVKVLTLTEGTSAAKTKKLDLAIAMRRSAGEALVVVVNYETAWRMKRLSELDWDLVVLDESQKVKSPTATVTKWAHRKLRPKAKKRVCLTGTPMPNSPLDLVGQCAFLDPRLFGTYKTAFLRRYAVMGGFEGREILRWVNEHEMQQRLSEVMISAKTEDVLELPDRHHVKVPVELEPRARRIYNELQKEFLADCELGTITAANALVKLLRLQQITGGATSTEDGDDVEVSTAKREALEELLAEIPASEPVVVFCRFRHDLAVVGGLAEGDYRELSGSRKELAEWDAGKARVLGVQISSGGVGVDLTRARHCIYYSLGFSLGDYEQSLARVHRPGQARKVIYHHLVARDTVDEKVYTALRRKQHVVEWILEGRKHAQRIERIKR